MKNATIFIWIFLFNTVFAQDIIVLKNGDEVKAKVMEVGIDSIKYKAFNNLEGLPVSISKAEIFMIKYENGSKESFKQTIVAKQETIDSSEIKLNMYYRQCKKSGSAIALSFIPIAGPTISHCYSKKNIGWGILLSIGQIGSLILIGTGQHDEKITSPYSGYTSYETVYEPAYYLGVVCFFGIPVISAISSADNVKKYNTELHNKIFNDKDIGLRFQIVPSYNGLYARAVYRF
ncbi:MAG: hypothetical protein HY738_02710 [Bacteroidia bacterium]|nr:hypothetical protein [Bacteroidia bacterium]